MRALFASLLVIGVGTVTLWQATDGLNALTTESARRLAVACTQPPVPNVPLETMSGSSSRLVSSDKITIVEFIYTRCPIICQTAGTYLARLRDRLKTHNLNERVRIVSVSFDPAYDDVTALADYGAAHGADGVLWTVARPGTQDLAKLLDAFGVTVIPDAFGGYEHNAALHVVSMSGRLIAIADIDDLDGALAAVAGGPS